MLEIYINLTLVCNVGSLVFTLTKSSCYKMFSIYLKKNQCNLAIQEKWTWIFACARKAMVLFFSGHIEFLYMLFYFLCKFAFVPGINSILTMIVF